jgi:hypothetical protein
VGDVKRKRWNESPRYEKFKIAKDITYPVLENMGIKQGCRSIDVAMRGAAV